VPEVGEFDDSRRLLIRAYFTMEYAFASAALFNPSIVPHPDQTSVADDALRLSDAATGFAVVPLERLLNELVG
jgi:hypothetical protein